MTHDIQQTSLRAYHTKEQFAPTQRRRILNAVEKHGNMTNREIQHETGIIISSVSARVYELRCEFHLLELAELRKCIVSGRQAMAWKVRA